MQNCRTGRDFQKGSRDLRRCMLCVEGMRMRSKETLKLCTPGRQLVLHGVCMYSKQRPTFEFSIDRNRAGQ